MRTTITRTDWIHVFMEILGDELRQRRQAHGWTRQDLLNHLRLEMSLETLGTYERGRRNITVVRLAQVTEALGTTAADILAQTYRRVFAQSDSVDGWTVDLAAAVRLTDDELAPLRRWATVWLNERRPTVSLDWTAIEHLAVLCRMNPVELARQLPASPIRGDSE